MDREGHNPADEPMNEPGPPAGFSGIWVRPLSDEADLEVEYADGKPNGRVRVWYRDTRSMRVADMLPRMSTRRWMVVVAAAGVVFGWVAHARRMLREEADFGGPIVMVEMMAAGLLLPIVFVIGHVARIIRREAAYVARLRHDEVPADVPRLTDEPDPPGPSY